MGIIHPFVCGRYLYDENEFLSSFTSLKTIVLFRAVQTPPLSIDRLRKVCKHNLRLRCNSFTVKYIDIKLDKLNERLVMCIK